MRFVFTCFLTIIILFLPFGVSASPSNEFWNPFRGSTINFSQEINSAIQKVIGIVQMIAGGNIDSLRIADPANYGLRTATYNRTNLGVKINSGVILPLPSPIRDTESEGTPCGGGSGDPFWANDCSCVCSTGKVHDLVYEVSDRCPEDDNRSCEDCRDITRHDNRYTKVSECRSDF